MLLSLVAHLFMDAIPHGDTEQYHRYKRQERVRRAVAFVTLDAIAALGLAAFVWTNVPLFYPSAIFWAIIGGVLPDVLVALFDIGRIRWLKPFHDFHFKIHFLLTHGRHDFRLPVGVGFQILLFYLFRHRIF